MPVLGEEGGWRNCGQRQGRWSPSWGWPPRARPGQGLLAQVRWTLPGPSHQWWDNRPGEGDPRGREPPWEGSLFTESPGSKLCHWAGGCFLELWKEQEKHGVLGSLPNPEFAPRRTPPRGEAHGIWKTQCLPCCLPPGAAAAPPQPAYRFFPVPFGAFRGHDWGPSGLCVASSRGPLGHRSPCPLGVTARMERHRDGRWGRTNVVGRERHGLCLES